MRSVIVLKMALKRLQKESQIDKNQKLNFILAPVEASSATTNSLKTCAFPRLCILAPFLDFVHLRLLDSNNVILDL